MPQRQADLVEPVQQAVLAKRVDVEMKALRVVEGRDALPLEVDAQPEAGEVKYDRLSRRRQARKPASISGSK